MEGIYLNVNSQPCTVVNPNPAGLYMYFCRRISRLFLCVYIVGPSLDDNLAICLTSTPIDAAEFHIAKKEGGVRAKAGGERVDA